MSWRFSRLKVAWIAILYSLSLVGSRPAIGESIFDFDDKALTPKTEPKEHAPASPSDHPSPATNPVAPPQTSDPQPVTPPRTSDTVISTPRAIPPFESRQKSQALMNQIYAKEMADHSPASRRALARRLLEEARKPDMDVSDRFVLLIGSYQSSAEGADLSFSAQAIDTLSHDFAIDALTTKLQCAMKRGFKADAAGLTAANCSEGLSLVSELVSADRIPDALRLLVAIKGAASSDVTQSAQIKKQDRKLESIQSERSRIAPYFEKLRNNASDAAASLAVGKYLCFYLDSWERGLPLLRAGTDAKIKTLAVSELQRPADATSRIELADGWWTVGQSQPEAARANIHAHAAAIYSQALPDTTGLRRVAILKRIDEASDHADVRIFDLLPAINDVKNGTIAGKFSLSKAGLSVQKDENPRLQITYCPPEQYDLNIEFNFANREGAVVFILPLAEGQVQLEFGGDRTHFAKEGGDPATGIAPFAEVNRPNTAIVKVRPDAVQVLLNSKTVLELKRTGQPIGMKPAWNLPSKEAIGVGCYHSDATISKLTLTEVAGHGKRLDNSNTP